jgi:hypothetical protein
LLTLLQNVILRVLGREYRVPKFAPGLEPQPFGYRKDQIGEAQQRESSGGEESPSSGRARKRPRLSRAEEETPISDLVQTLTSSVYNILDAHPANGLEGLGHVVL